jgi:hypothetical protein
MNLVATGGWVSAGQHGRHLASSPCPDRKVSQRPENNAPFHQTARVLRWWWLLLHDSSATRQRDIHLLLAWKNPSARVQREVRRSELMFTSSDVMGRSSFVLCFSSDAMHTSKPSPMLRIHAQPPFLNLPHRSPRVCCCLLDDPRSKIVLSSDGFALLSTACKAELAKL